MGLGLGGLRGADFLVRLGLRLFARAARSCLARSCSCACCCNAAQVLSLMIFHMASAVWASSISAIRMAVLLAWVGCVVHAHVSKSVLVASNWGEFLVE